MSAETLFVCKQQHKKKFAPIVKINCIETETGCCYVARQPRLKSNNNHIYKPHKLLRKKIEREYIAYWQSHTLP